MNHRHRAGMAVVAGVLLMLDPVASAMQAQKETAMTARANGTFSVKLVPQKDAGMDASLGRMTIDKQFHGDLEAASVGQMLTGGAVEKGSAGYVAIEKVSGTLNGRKGSFILLHRGIMNRGTPELSITVVPDSGTDELTGIKGQMKIDIAAGNHSYEFEYSLP